MALRERKEKNQTEFTDLGNSTKFKYACLKYFYLTSYLKIKLWFTIIID